MITFKLWHIINHPPRRNPLYFRTYNTAEQPAPWYIARARSAAMIFLLPVIAITGMTLFLPIMGFTAAIYGMGWAVGISNIIARERVQNRYDLFSLTPSGPLGISWAIAAGYLYYQRTFRNINKPGNLWLRIGIVVALLSGMDFLFTLDAIFGEYEVDTVGLLLMVGLRFITLLAVMYIDHLQSITVSILTGMLASTFSAQRTSAQLIAFSLYLGVQLTTYLVAFIGGFFILPELFALFSLNGVFAEMILFILRLILFIGLREALMIGLWRVLLVRLNAQPAEMGIAA